MNASQNRNYSDNSPEKSKKITPKFNCIRISTLKNFLFSPLDFFAFQNEDQEQADADMPSYIRALFGKYSVNRALVI